MKTTLFLATALVLALSYTAALMPVYGWKLFLSMIAGAIITLLVLWALTRAGSRIQDQMT